MSLQDKIKKIINVISDTDINEIEITSFWGAQKIRLSKSLNSTVNEEKKQTSVKEVLTENSFTDNPTKVKSSIEENTLDSEPLESSNLETTFDVEKNKDSELGNFNDEDLIYQKAPLVGTFYASAKPGEPAFVKEGDEVVKGQLICIIEAMKIFNEIESDFTGTIVEIQIEDQNPVEFNQPIFSIREK